MNANCAELELELTLPTDKGPRGKLALTVFTPHCASTDPTVMFCAHGATYNRRYWSFVETGDNSYSFAKFMADRGNIVVAWDALGTGESTAFDHPWQITSRQVAHAGHIMVEEITGHLREGRMPGWPLKAERVRTIGIGHSLGGMTVARQQGRHSSYDAVVILGWTNMRRCPSPYISSREAELEAALASLISNRDPEEAEGMLFELKDFPTLADCEADFEVYRRSQQEFFYWDDVPADVVMADTRLGQPRRGAMWVVSRIPGLVNADTAKIDVPVFLGYGERDISADPSCEPSFYKSSTDVMLHILHRSAHCHNFASTRSEQWSRIAWWAERVGGLRSGGSCG